MSGRISWQAWQKRFRYILIDEFQDINQIQYEIVRMLARPENNLFIVGDDDQSIYRFRGARPEIMLNFRKDYPDAKIILLEENFRSVENIIRAAGKVIACNEDRYQKTIHGVREAGERIVIHGFAGPGQENLYLIKKIQDYIREGYRWQDIAVLFRTNTAGRLAVEKFMEYNIPFQMRDTMPNIYDHWITRNIISYIKMAMGNRDRREFLQIMNRPKRYISREAADAPKISFEELRMFYEEKEWMQDRIDKLENDLLSLKKMTPYAAINYIRHGIGYEEYLNEYALFRKIRPEELYEVLNELQEAAKNFQTYEAWFQHMDDYAKALQEQAKQQKGWEDAVIFTTLHSSKGLEFPIVFILDVNEGSIPHRKAVLDVDVQEERRMFYVGMTRAKERLHLYYVKEKIRETCGGLPLYRRAAAVEGTAALFFLFFYVVLANHLVEFLIVHELVKCVSSSFVLVVAFDVGKRRLSVYFFETVQVNFAVFILPILIQRKQGDVIFVASLENGQDHALLYSAVI